MRQNNQIVVFYSISPAISPFTQGGSRIFRQNNIATGIYAALGR
jgi:hypothetical protein